MVDTAPDDAIAANVLTTRTGALRARLTGPTVRKGAWATADQALVSLANFATSILLARFCPTEEYGAYVLAASIMFFVNGVHEALITAPMVILGAPKEGPELGQYVLALAAAQAAFAAFASVIVLAVAVLLGPRASGEGLAAAFLGMGVAVLFVQSREFFRRILYMRLALHRAFWSDAVFSVLQFGGLVSLWRAGGGMWSPPSPGYLSARNAFLCLAASSAVGVALGFFLCRRYVGRSLGALRAALRENWRFGKWGLGTSVAALASYEIYKYVLASAGGLGNAAALGACMSVIAFSNPFVKGMRGLFAPLASRKLSNDGPGKLRASVFWWVLGTGTIMGIFVVLVTVFARPLLHALYGGKYDGYALVLGLLSVGAFLGASAAPVTAGLGALRLPNKMFVASAAAALTSLVVGLPLSLGLGVLGAALGIVLANCTSVTTRIVSFGRALAQRTRLEREQLADARTPGR